MSLFGDERDRQVYDVVPFNLWFTACDATSFENRACKQRTQQQLGLFGSRPFRSRRMVMTEALNDAITRVIYISAPSAIGGSSDDGGKGQATLPGLTRLTAG